MTRLAGPFLFVLCGATIECWPKAEELCLAEMRELAIAAGPGKGYCELAWTFDWERLCLLLAPAWWYDLPNRAKLLFPSC